MPKKEKFLLSPQKYYELHDKAKIVDEIVIARKKYSRSCGDLLKIFAPLAALAGAVLALITPIGFIAFIFTEPFNLETILALLILEGVSLFLAFGGSNLNETFRALEKTDKFLEP